MDEEMISSNDEGELETDDEDYLPVIELSDNESDHSDGNSVRVRAAGARTLIRSSPEPDSDSREADVPAHSTPVNHDVARASSQRRTVGPKGAENSMDEDGQNCTICFEPWTNSSEHRLVSLRCGHLFGRSCITRWLKGQNARCPQCNARARKSEIRNIYAKSVKALDSSERDKALEELQKERETRRRVEMDYAREKLSHMMALQECERLKKELIETTKLLQEYRSGSKLMDLSQAAKKNSSIFSLDKSIEIFKNGGCRIVDVCDLLGLILVSQPTNNDMFPGHGFRKIAAQEMKLAEFVLVHQKPIKDMAFHSHDGLVLTASLDKTVKITNVLTNSVVQTYSLDCDAWSCAWDSDDPMYFYGGLRNGGVLLFDIRVTSRSVNELPRFGSNTPVVAIQCLRKLSLSNPSKSGPVVGKLSDCSFYQKLDEVGDYKILPLPCFGPFTSLSSELTSGHFLISCRPSVKQPRVSHMVCELGCDKENGDLICNPVQTILGGRTQLQLTRSKLLPNPADPSSLLICAGDEDSHGALVWNSSNGECIDKLRTESPVLDLAELKMNQKSYLLALTEKTLKVYGWNCS
ncbi:E3 ubiquitin-protein ligase rfwd3.S [Parasteatoda tepidariorum]|uniref:E3 ubiquitin-protein ligase rfwd3.S n=1 Tax=Parasteatoda tepidariorum TaxID=114398 RepID=UPI0039BCC8DE